ncbi:MAG: fimbrillin family protein [Odoribacter splanchnicus]
MKIQNIYHLLQAALLLLLVSCTQEEFPAVQDKAQQLTISVTDGGYTSAVENMKTRVETRAVENGYTTEFTEGDACGFYMVRGGKPVYSNVKLTAEKGCRHGRHHVENRRYDACRRNGWRELLPLLSLSGGHGGQDCHTCGGGRS